MTLSDFVTKLHLPSIAAHFSWEQPLFFRNLPGKGWWATSRSRDQVYNAIDLFAYNSPGIPKDDVSVMQYCYRYFTQQHPELLEQPLRYSESNEKYLIRAYEEQQLWEKFYLDCRAEALAGSLEYKTKKFRFSQLLLDEGMPELINSGIGIVTTQSLGKQFEKLKLKDVLVKNTLILPTFFAPGKIASLEMAEMGNITNRKIIYVRDSAGWYGNFDSHRILGKLTDLYSVQGCVWNAQLANWIGGIEFKLHNTIQPPQCIEIWTNHNSIKFDKDPLSLIPKTDLIRVLKDNLGKINFQQLKELERITKFSLHKEWINLRNSETVIAGLRFIHRDGRYYYVSRKGEIEFTNFCITLDQIKKEGDEFWQYGDISMNDEIAPFRIKRKYFVNQNSLMKALTATLIENGVGIPLVAPNLKHYLPNVIENFNPINKIEKPAKVVEIKTEEPAPLPEL